MHRIFVYGTLKKGDCRHHFLSTQSFLGVAATQSEYRLYNLGDYPGLVHERGGGHVEGEIYEVTESCLMKLDVVEGVASGLYSRQTVKLMPPWNETTTQTYIYEQSVHGCSAIGYWPVN